MRTLAVLVSALVSVAADLSAAIAPPSVEVSGRAAADLQRFLELCDQHAVVLVAAEERFEGKVVFTCKDVLKATDRNPIAGEMFEFSVAGTKRDVQPHETILFLRRLPPGGSFRAHRLSDGRRGALSIADLKHALQSRKG